MSIRVTSLNEIELIMEIAAARKPAAKGKAAPKKPAAKRKVSEATKKKIAKSVKKTHATGVKVDRKKAGYEKAKKKPTKAAKKAAAKKKPAVSADATFAKAALAAARKVHKAWLAEAGKVPDRGLTNEESARRKALMAKHGAIGDLILIDAVQEAYNEKAKTKLTLLQFKARVAKLARSESSTRLPTAIVNVLEPEILARLPNARVADGAGEFHAIDIGKAKASRKGIEHKLGEHIGGSRADRAVKTGKMAGDATEEAPAWRKRYMLWPVEVSKRNTDGSHSYVEEWMVLDRRRRSKNRGYGPGFMPVKGCPRFESKDMAEGAIAPLAANEAFQIREDGPAYKNPDGSPFKDADGKPVPAVSLYARPPKTGSHRYAAGPVVAGPFPGKEAAVKYLVKNAVELLSKKPKAEKSVDDLFSILHIRNPDGSYVLGDNGKMVGRYKIWRRKVSGRHSTLVDIGGPEFNSRSEAEEYIKANADELMKKHKTGLGEEMLATPEKVYRVGPAWRKGDRDAKPKEFLDTFGMRGAEFGHWQGTRQTVLNHAFDGMMDLADVLGVEPKSLSLKRLALAFGARGKGGKGGARAHYEPSYVVMNLTKTGGAGSLAHEWGHAFDHLLAILDDPRLEGETPTKGNGSHFFASNRVGANRRYPAENLDPAVRKAYADLMNSFISKQVSIVRDSEKEAKTVADGRKKIADELKHIRDGLATEDRYAKRKKEPARQSDLDAFDRVAARMMSTSNPIDLQVRWDSSKQAWTNHMLDEMDAIYRRVRGKSGLGTKKAYGVLNNVRWYAMQLGDHFDRMAKYDRDPNAKLTVPTEFLRGSEKLDKTRTTPYWRLAEEMFARAFSAYVEDKLTAQKRKSDYLSFGSDNKHYGIHAPFPEGDERAAINSKMDAFFAAIRASGILKPAATKVKWTPPKDVPKDVESVGDKPSPTAGAAKKTAKDDLDSKPFDELRKMALKLKIQPARSREKMLERIKFFQKNPTAGLPKAESAEKVKKSTAKERQPEIKSTGGTTISLPRSKDRLTFEPIVGGKSGAGGSFSIKPARYAKGKVSVSAPGHEGFKTRAGRLAEGCGGSYSRRESSYIMSPKQAETFYAKFHAGWDYSPIENEMKAPADEPPAGKPRAKRGEKAAAAKALADLEARRSEAMGKHVDAMFKR